MRVIFWGSPEFSVPPLKAVHEAGHEIVAAVCQPDRPSGRGRKLSAPPVKQAAVELGLEVLQPDKPRGDKFLDSLRALKPDISVVVAYGHILIPAVLEIPRHGSINLHASLLPAWRGAAPIQRAIAAGDRVGGLTVIQMDEGMDTGNILAVREMEIGPDETAGELACRMSGAGGPLLVETLEKIERGLVEPRPQDHEAATYAPKIDRAEARLDWSRPADDLHCRIRAFDPVPGAWTERAGDTLKVFRPSLREDMAGEPGELHEIDSGGLVVRCGDGALEIGEVQPQGKRRMGASDYLRGHPVEPGDRVE